MGDDKKAKKPRGKKLAVNKETIQELTDEALDQVAGGVCAPSVVPTGVQGQGPIGPTGARNLTKACGDTDV
jgi:hypothetical protein